MLIDECKQKGRRPRTPRSTIARPPSTYVITTEDFAPEYRLLRMVNGELVEIPPPNLEENHVSNEEISDMLNTTFNGVNEFNFDAAYEDYDIL